MRKLKGYLRLMRPLNSLMMGIAVIVGASLADPNILYASVRQLTHGFITGFMLTAASMTINDCYDKEIDAVNEPDRPIPSGTVKVSEALALASILTAIGFISAYLTNDLCLVIAVIAFGVFLVYTFAGKRSGLPGNLLVSTCVAVPFIYGSAALVNNVELNVLLFISMAFLANTGREVTKGIVDVEGDEKKSVKTLAVRYGEKHAAIASAIFYISAVLLSPLPWILGLVSSWFIPFVAITDVGLLASSLMLLSNQTRERARRIKNLALLWFLSGLLGFVAGVAV